MKNLALYFFTALLSIALLQACGEQQNEAEIERDQQAVQDSLERVYEAEMEQMRRDSVEQARADSIAAEEERRRVDFSDSGEFVVQVEAWRSQVKAQVQAEEWKNRGYDRSFVVTYGDQDTGDVWYRVRIGRFETREMAERFENKLSEVYNAQSWVSRLDEPIEEEAMQED